MLFPTSSPEKGVKPSRKRSHKYWMQQAAMTSLRLGRADQDLGTDGEQETIQPHRQRLTPGFWPVPTLGDTRK